MPQRLNRRPKGSRGSGFARPHNLDTHLRWPQPSAYGWGLAGGQIRRAVPSSRRSLFPCERALRSGSEAWTECPKELALEVYQRASVRGRPRASVLRLMRQGASSCGFYLRLLCPGRPQSNGGSRLVCWYPPTGGHIDAIPVQSLTGRKG